MESLVVVERRMNLYIDMLINLTYKIHQTHPGYDCLVEYNDIENHFIWCFDSVCSDFLNKDIKTKGLKITDTLFEFFFTDLYSVKKMKNIEVYLNIWKIVFSGKNIDSVLYVYRLYEKFDELLKK